MAVQAGVPIVPVVISNYYDLYSAKEKRFDAGNLRCRGNIYIYMTWSNHPIYSPDVFRPLVLPPISTESVAEDSADIEKLANECRDQMLATLKEITPARQIKNKSQ